MAKIDVFTTNPSPTFYKRLANIYTISSLVVAVEAISCLVRPISSLVVAVEALSIISSQEEAVRLYPALSVPFPALRKQ